MSDIVRSSYTFHACFHDALSELSDDKYGRLMRAINEFALYGKEPSPMVGVELMVWKLVLPIVMKGRNKANGKAGAPRGNRNNSYCQSKYNQHTNTEQSKTIQSEMKEPSLHNQSSIIVQSKFNQMHQEELSDEGTIIMGSPDMDGTADSPADVPCIWFEPSQDHDGFIKVQSKDNQRTAKEQSKYNQSGKKEVPLVSPLEETPPIPSKEDSPPFIPPENAPATSGACVGAYEGFTKWMKENCPYVFKNITMLSEAEFLKLQERFGSDAIAEVCLNLENRKDLRKKYSNLYRTLSNWLKRSHEHETALQSKRPATAVERTVAAAREIASFIAARDGSREQPEKDDIAKLWK